MRIKRISNGFTSFPGEYVFPPRSEDDRCVDDDLDEHPRVPRSARLTNRQTSPVRAPPSFLTVRITSRDDLFTVALFSGLPLGVLFRTIQGGDRKGSRFQRKALLSLVSGTMISLMTFGKTTVHAFYLSLPSLCLLKLTSSTKAGDSRPRAKDENESASGL